MKTGRENERKGIEKKKKERKNKSVEPNRRQNAMASVAERARCSVRENAL